MQWLIQDNETLASNTDALVSACQVLNVTYRVMKTPRVVPFMPRAVPYGSVKFVDAAVELGYKTFTLPEWDVYGHFWRKYSLNGDADILPFGWVYKTETFSIKPTKQHKAFNGVVCTWDQYLTWREDIATGNTEGYYGLTLDTEVLVNRVIPIKKEYRFFVIDGEVVTGSLYREDNVRREIPFFGTPWFDSEILAYCQTCISIWCPNAAFVLDIAITEGQPKVLEINCLNTSGLYGCDAVKIVAALEKLDAGTAMC